MHIAHLFILKQFEAVFTSKENRPANNVYAPFTCANGNKLKTLQKKNDFEAILVNGKLSGKCNDGIIL